MPNNTFLLYGASGYTGELIARLAVESGLRPILAGRDKSKFQTLAKELKLDVREFGLDQADAIDAAIRDVPVVMHCAGPFSRTYRPMVEACLRNRVHYLDITGEIEIFEALAARDTQAKEAEIMLMPGTGFDVVPSDCLAAHLKRRLPTATHLALAIKGMGRISQGTATTIVENIGRGGALRKDGRITLVPAAAKTRRVEFNDKSYTVTLFPWGDVATAFHSTGIPNIEVYFAVPASLRRMIKTSRYLKALLTSGPMQTFMKKRIKAGPAGPSEEERRNGSTIIWGEVTDAQGKRAVSRLHTGEGYDLTARTAVNILGKVLAGNFRAGFSTPSLAYGPDLIMEIDGVRREDDATAMDN
jgi:short subunit dehydrogenase-like uncharacterized protein